MYLTILDLILILILFMFIAFGFALGLVQTFGALIGVVLGVYVAGLFFDPVGNFLTPIMMGNPIVAKIVAFVLVFVIVNRLVGLVFWIINKIFNLLSIIPFAKSLNRILGALFGLAEGVLVLGVILFFIGHYVNFGLVADAIVSSKVAVVLFKIGSILGPLLPQMVLQLNSII